MQLDAQAAWFSRRRFGLFLHFGLYAIDGWHEQDQPVLTTTEILPAHWQSGSRVLAIRQLPRERLAGETLVVRLDFDAPLAGGRPAASEFQG